LQRPISLALLCPAQYARGMKPLSTQHAIVIGGGPAGLMAAEVLAGSGLGVDLYEAKPSPGRKFLVAGVGGLNLTHSEDLEMFLSRYGLRRERLEPLLRAFGPLELRAWAGDLGFETFVGSSGRVFPSGMKAAPLLRAWLARLKRQGVRFHTRHRWRGWDRGGNLLFDTRDGPLTLHPSPLVLALGGGSWPQLGSDGSWVPVLEARGIPIAPLKPSNCGFEVSWSRHFRERYAGWPVKPVALSFEDSCGALFSEQGEFVITEYGLEGSLVYAASALIRDEIARSGSAQIFLDLHPDRPQEWLRKRFATARSGDSLAKRLRKAAGIRGVKGGLLRECSQGQALSDPARQAAALKRLPLVLKAPRPLAEAISTAGGVKFEALDENLMLRDLPGVFCAGEMLDWEAPTGGYLLTACFASGFAAAKGLLASQAAL
jgi:uncharacterized flavoprotein (TIGR03862 family)